MAARKRPSTRASARAKAIDSIFDAARTLESRKAGAQLLEPKYTYRATLNRVVDGDTVWLYVDVGFHIEMNMDFRLAGINCPEMTGATKDAGLASRKELVRLLGLGPLTVVSQKADKYGRWLGTLYVTDKDGLVINVNNALVLGGFAVTYMAEG